MARFVGYLEKFFNRLANEKLKTYTGSCRASGFQGQRTKMKLNPANDRLQKRLAGVRTQITMAIEDAAEDFHGGIAHAEIALANLKEIVAAGKSARQDVG